MIYVGKVWYFYMMVDGFFDASYLLALPSKRRVVFVLCAIDDLGVDGKTFVTRQTPNRTVQLEGCCHCCSKSTI